MSIKYQKFKIVVRNVCGVMCIEERIQTVSSLNKLDHNLSHVSSVCNRNEYQEDFLGVNLAGAYG